MYKEERPADTTKKAKINLEIQARRATETKYLKSCDLSRFSISLIIGSIKILL